MKEPIAIVGIGYPQKFWKLLCAQQDAIGKVPQNRWDIRRFYDPNSALSGKMYVDQMMRDQFPNLQVLGRIIIWNNTLIGQNSIITCNTFIGANCIIGAGAVVRGTIPDNSVVVGNPGKVIMTTDMMKSFLLNHPNRLDILNLPQEERKEVLMKHFGITLC